MVLDGIGLPGTDGHRIKETANIDYLPIEAKRSAVLIYRLIYGNYQLYDNYSAIFCFCIFFS